MLPAIVQWNESQYVVFCGFDGEGACINHPGKGKLHVGEDEFRRSYSGTCLFLSPGEKFEASGKKRGAIDHRLSTIRSCDRIIALDKGRIVESGSYDELMEKDGFFAELVKRQQIDEG